MKTTSVSAAKNGLSALLDRVKAGEAVLITERGVPIARIEPVMTPHDPTGRQQRLSRAGLLDPGSGALSQDFYAVLVLVAILTSLLAGTWLGRVVRSGAPLR